MEPPNHPSGVGERAVTAGSLEPLFRRRSLREPAAHEHARASGDPVQTGLRVSELIALRVQDVVFGTGAHVRCAGKERKERCTPLR